MIEIYKKTNNQEPLERILDIESGVWIHTEHPSDEELEQLAEKAHLDIGLLRDAVDPYEVPRIEKEGETVYIFARMPHPEGLQIATTPLTIVITPLFIITIAIKPIPLFQKFIKGHVQFHTTQRVKLFLQMFAEVNGVYNFFMTQIIRQVRRASAELEKIESKDVLQFVAFENVLNDFMGALLSMQTTFQSLISGKYIYLYEEDAELVEDITLEKGQLVELCRTTLKNIVNIRSAYATIMTHDLNHVIKVLTSLTIIISVPSLIMSLYGMNIRLPGAETPHAFWWVIGGSVVAALCLWSVFIKNRWL